MLRPSLEFSHSLPGVTERTYDKEEYKKRNVVERFINVIKQCRRVATRYEKMARNFLGVVALASTFVLLN
jgi:transposase